MRRNSTGRVRGRAARGAALGLALLGGLLFAHTYAHTQSLLVSSIEHALYGCLLFSSPLGPSFYDGSW